ncbi:hypothetical protein [Herpetosiphon geysericola]|uniref:Uncharacterized protein n=1 Tax=Herpetosiphon geysericola TaxID=70996 RepID=A0A0N8GRD1_9CHLR|nr:hypothetical protein [Herpetosiphon geysericola]KPL86162.1 hypothetical protein SE18_15010 [Herpetosiphon geysericola]
MVRFFRSVKLFTADNGGGGSGGASGNPAPATPPANPPANPPASGSGNQPDIAGQIANLVARQGGPDAALMLLMQENYQYRDQNRQLRERTPEGSVVLSGDDVQRWRDYQALGQLDELRIRLTEREQAQTELATLRTQATIRGVAEAMQWKPSVLERLAGNVTFVTKTEGDTTTISVKDGDVETSLQAYADKHWSEFMPALTTDTAPARRGTNFVQQGAGNVKKTDVMTTHNQKMGYSVPKRGN